METKDHPRTRRGHTTNGARVDHAPPALLLQRTAAVVLAIAGPALPACSDAGDPGFQVRSAVIFGTDDRKNLIDPGVTAAARGWADAVGVMAGLPAKVVGGKFPKDALCLETTFADACYLNTALATKGPVTFDQISGQGYGLCKNEKFAQESVLRPEVCTVFRLPQTSTGEELFLTAGHCLKATGAPQSEFGRECKDAEFAFGFQVRSFGTEHPTVGLPFALRRKWDVYKCKEVVARAEPLSNTIPGDKSDFTLFKADRVVRARRLLDVRRTNTLALNQQTTVAGHGAGFPLKITPTGVVKQIDSTANTFDFSTDALQGDSGGPVVDVATGLVTGILGTVPVENFYIDSGANCARVAPNPPCSDSTGCAGSGYFSGATDIMEVGTVPNLPTSPTLYADLDGDGVADKVSFVSTLLVWSIDVKFSSGQSCPGCPIPTLIPALVPLGQIAASASVGDFNGDGVHDIIVQLSTYPTVYIEGVNLTKLLTDPFAASQAFFGMDQYAGTLVGDFNSDGLDDVRAFSSSGTHSDVLMGTPSADPGQSATFAGGLAPSIEIPAECGNGLTYIVPGNYSSMFPSLTAYTSTRGVAVVPGSLVGLSDPTLLVIDCPGAAKQNQLKLLDPLTGQVRKTISMSGTSEWRAFAYRASKNDVIGLRSIDNPGAAYEIVRLGLSSSSSATATVLATRTQNGIATGIGWDDSNGEIGVLVTNSCFSLSKCGDDRIDYFNETAPGTWAHKNLSIVPQKACATNYSKPWTVEPSGLVMSGASEMVACNRRGFGIGYRDARSRLVLNEVGSVAVTPWQKAFHLHDVECDTKTYASVLQTVVWGVSRSGRVLRALPVSSSDCGFGGQPPATSKCVVSQSNVAAIAAGGSSTLFVSNDGTVRGAGDNSNGQLGLPVAATVPSATPVAGYAGATAVTVGPTHSLALFPGGTVKATGSNSAGQLGRGDVLQTSAPSLVADLPPVTTIAAGAEFSVALAADGSVWAWGANDMGQLGDGTRTSRSVPVRVRGLETISSSFALAFGSHGSADGQFSQPRGIATDTTSVFVSDATNRVQRFLPDGTLSAVFGSTGTGPGQFVGSSGLHAAARRDGTVLYVLDPGAIEIQKFAVVPPSQTCPAGTVEVASSGVRVCFVTRWGHFGIADGDLASPSGLVAGTSGELFVTDAGNHRVQRYVHVASASTCPAGTTEVSNFGAERTCAAGYFGTYGNGDGELNAPRAVACDPDTAALYVADTGNSRVQRFSKEGAFLGKWGTYGTSAGQFDQPVDVDVDDLGRVVVTEAGNARAQIFTAGGLPLAVLGTLGTGNGQFTAPVGAAVLGSRVFIADAQQHRVEAFDVSGQPGVVRITAGGRHALAVLADGAVWSWGANDAGQLGAGSGAPASSTVPLRVVDPSASSGVLFVSEISAGTRHSLASKADGSMRAWGSNSDGQLGDGTTVDRYAPTVVLNASDVKSVRAGATHSLALTAYGHVLAWGANSHGQLGDGTFAGRAVPAEVRALCTPSAFLTNTTDIAAGSRHSIARGSLWGWGDDSLGQLGDGGPADLKPVAVPIAFSTGPDCSQAVATPGTIWPPNGSLVGVNIAGVVGGEGLVSIEVTDVQQDEPQAAPGQGQADPDAVIGGAGFPVRLRAERAGGGDGRVYHVGFTARDASGRECKGNVEVCVPHHSGATCGNGGAQWDSTNLGGADICETAEPTLIDDCQACIRSRCCAELRACLPPERCSLGGPSGEGEFACITDCLALAFYGETSLATARTECATTCAKPRPKPSQATTNLVSCMLGLDDREDSCIAQCLGAPLE